MQCSQKLVTLVTSSSRIELNKKYFDTAKERIESVQKETVNS